MKKHSWYIELTDVEFAALKKGMGSYFRFYLFSNDAITYDKIHNTVSIMVSIDSCPRKTLLEELSIYINGFSCCSEI